MTMAVMYNGKTLRENCEEMGLNYATVLERRRKHPFQDPKESLIPPRTNCGGRGHAKFFTERGTQISILYESKGDYDRIISAYKYWGSYSEAAQRIRIDWTDEKIESWCRRLGLNLGKAKKLFAKGTCIEDIYLALMTKTCTFPEWCEENGVPFFEARYRMQKNPDWNKKDLLEWFERSKDYVFFEGKWELAFEGMPIKLLFSDDDCEKIKKQFSFLKLCANPRGRVARAVELLKKKGWKL